MASDYDEARPEVVEASEKTLEAVRKIDAPTAKSVQTELEESDTSETPDLPGAIVLEELEVTVVPQAEDEFICEECFVVRHHTQLEEKNGKKICKDCVNEYI